MKLLITVVFMGAAALIMRLLGNAGVELNMLMRALIYGGTFVIILRLCTKVDEKKKAKIQDVDVSRYEENGELTLRGAIKKDQPAESEAAVKDENAANGQSEAEKEN